jgi:hypothetical protein
VFLEVEVDGCTTNVNETVEVVARAADGLGRAVREK